MDKKQLIAAINRRVSSKLKDHEIASLDMILFIALYHPVWKGISVQELAAQLTRRGYYSDYEIKQHLPASVASAKEQGYPIVEGEDITTRYQVAFERVVNSTPKKIGEVFQVVYARLEELDLLPDETMFLWPLVDENAPWPQGRWVSSYGVAGGNEGHWLHVGVVEQHDEKWETETRARYVATLLEAGADEAHANQYARAILKLDRKTINETVIPVFGGKTLREGADGMEAIYKTAAEIAKMLA